MPTTPANPRREIAFLLADVARLLRTATDQKARELGTSRARWAVLVRLQRCQGLSQNELAALLDIQPITLGRLVDKLCDEGLVERRADAADRRVRRLHLTDKAYPVLDGLATIGDGLMAGALAGLDEADQARLTAMLITIKDNLRRLSQVPAEAGTTDRRAS